MILLITNRAGKTEEGAQHIAEAALDFIAFELSVDIPDECRLYSTYQAMNQEDYSCTICVDTVREADDEIIRNGLGIHDELHELDPNDKDEKNIITVRPHSLCLALLSLG